MKLFNRILLICFAFSLVLAACKKTDFLKNEPTGESIKEFSLLAPAANTTVAINPATPNEKLVISWAPTASAVNLPVVYKWVAIRKSAANFDAANRVFEVPSDNSGKATTLTITYKQLDDLLKATGFATAPLADLVWAIEADNGTTKTLSPDSRSITIRRSANGTSPFTVLGPVNSTNNITISPNSTSDNLKFNWTKSIPAASSPAVKYVVNVYKDDASTTPLFTMVSDNAGADSLKTISHKAFSDSLTKYGFTNNAEAAKLRWNVTATSGTWVQTSDFSNQLYVIREVKVYIVGGATPIGWDPTKALRLREDASKPGVFYIYTELKTGGNGFKFLSMQADWSAPGQTEMGEDNGADGSGNNAANNTGSLRLRGANIAVPATGDGIYRVTVDLNNNKYYIQTATANGIGGMGLIGDFQSWAQPAVKMDYVTVNRFNYLTNMSSGNGFKFHDGNDWDNGAANKSRWFGLNGTTLAEQGVGNDNVTYTGATGLVRTIWDATDPVNLRYSVIPGKLYAIGGDAGLGSWNNSVGNTAMPEFTYLGNGKWKADITVSGPSQFKLVMQQGNWDMLWGKGAAAGTMANRYYDADKDPFEFTAAGTYTVLVDEYAGTISW
ncbi:MAG TPA: SusE domain-containing protein [Flavisolibacter sp.]|nr:SusE domain-containing protein [Flavisolibacter sp.]